MSSIVQLVSAYRATALAWDSSQDNPKKANELFDRLHLIFNSLRSSEAGRSGLAELMSGASVAVRLMVAARSLTWAPDEASKVLKVIESGPGLHAADALTRAGRAMPQADPEL